MSDTRPPVIDAEAIEVAANAPKPSAQSFLPAVQTAAARWTGSEPMTVSPASTSNASRWAQ